MSEIRDRIVKVLEESHISFMEEGIKDYLPRTGFIRNDDEDKDSSKIGAFLGQGTDEQMRMAKIIAKVKFANGDRIGRVSSEDLKHFDEYKKQYDEMFGSSEEIEEGWKDNLKKAAGVAAVAGGLMAGGAQAADNQMYVDPYEDNDIPPSEYSELFKGVKEIDQINQTVTDEYGNVWSFDEWQELQDNIDPNGEGNPPEKLDKSYDSNEEDM